MTSDDDPDLRHRSASEPRGSYWNWQSGDGVASDKGKGTASAPDCQMPCVSRPIPWRGAWGLGQPGRATVGRPDSGRERNTGNTQGMGTHDGRPERRGHVSCVLLAPVAESASAVGSRHGRGEAANCGIARGRHVRKMKCARAGAARGSGSGSGTRKERAYPRSTDHHPNLLVWSATRRPFSSGFLFSWAKSLLG